MLDFDERDLPTFLETVGFADIHLELRADITRAHPERWEAFLRQSGNPKIPTHEEALQEALSPAEAEQFVAHLRPLVESGRGTRRMALAYLWAMKHAT